MTNSRFRLSARGLPLLGILGLGLISTSAMAVIPVTVDNCESFALTGAPICASEGTAYAQYTYLTSGVSMSMASAAGDGLMPLLRKIADNTASGNESARQDMPNTDLANRALSDQNNAENAMYQATMPISQAACSEASVGGGMGGAGAASKAAKDAAQKGAETSFLTPHTEDDYVAGLVNAPSAANYCTQADVDNKVPNCTHIGSLPGANTDPSSLIRGAGTANERTFSYTWPSSANAGDASSASVPYAEAGTYPQYNAAMAYIQMAAPLPAPKGAANGYQSMAGKAYLINQRRYNSRALAVVNTLFGIASESAALPANNSFVQTTWNASSSDGMSLKDDFALVYPGTNPPTSPSERELMELLVLRQFDSKVEQNDLGMSNPIDLAKKQIELAKVNAYVNLKIAERMDTQNILLANLLSNTLDPVTRQQLLDSSGNGGKAAASP